MADERGGNRIIEAYLKMKNPYTVKLSPKQFTDNIAEAPSIRYAKEHGHDGVIFEYDGSKEDLDYDKFYVVFDSAQIKSATDNIGTFDKTNPDIRYSSQDGRYRDLMGEKAVKYTKGILCAYRKIKKSLSKTGEGFLYRCTIIPITPFTKTMRSDKDTSGTPETIRTSDPSLRSMAYHVIHGSDVTSNRQVQIRTTAARRQKKKSRRRADNLTRPFETAALIFRAAVSLRLHKPMTTCRDTVADGRLICRVLLFISQYP